MYTVTQHEFDPQTKHVNEQKVLRVPLFDIIAGKMPPDDARVFIDAKLYETPRTMLAALPGAGRRYSDSFTSVYTSSRFLEELIQAELGTELVMTLTIPPDEVEDKVWWRNGMLARSLGIGCTSFLVEPQDAHQLAIRNPGILFFSEDVVTV